MSACGAGCGYCGRCSGPWDDERYDEREQPVCCDECGEQVGHGETTLTIGTFCSVGCVDEHTARELVEVPADLKGVA